MATATKPNLNATEIVTRYAEAWRNKSAAEKEIEDCKAQMQDLLKGSDQSYTYADGATVDFKLVGGHRVAPVSYKDAQEITGFGEANMRKIAGPVDAKKVDALVKLGTITAKVAAKLLPKAPYLQVRGTFRK